MNTGLFEYWGRQLQQELKARLVPTAAREAFGEVPRGRVSRELLQPALAIFGAAAPAGRDTLSLDSLLKARATLVAQRGADPSTWAWGAIHTMTFRDALDGTAAGAAFLDRGPLRRAGDGGVVQATKASARLPSSRGRAPAIARFSISRIGITRWASTCRARAASPAANTTMICCQSRYFPLSFSKQAVEPVTSDTLILTPWRGHAAVPRESHVPVFSGE